ncbi:hypothetical protein [Thermococcus sp.]
MHGREAGEVDMTIRYEPYTTQERIVRLFREAIELENRRELDGAKKKLDEILELAKDRYPEFYFEACFRMGDIFLQEDNYRGAIKCAMRAMMAAPSEELYLLGAERIKAIVMIAKENDRLDELGENFETTLAMVKNDKELHSFLMAIIGIVRGELREVPGNIKTEKLREALRILLD